MSDPVRNDNELLRSLCKAAREETPPKMEALHAAILVSAPKGATWASLTVTTKAVLGVVCGAAVAGGVALWHPWSPPQYLAPAPKSSDAVTSERPSVPAPAMEAIPTFSVDDLPKSPSPQGPKPLPIAPPASDLTAQAKALDEARAALASGDATRAVGDIEAFHRSFPSSPLAEEADIVRLQALEQAGSKDASRLAKEFLEKYPSSPYAGRASKIAGAR